MPYIEQGRRLDFDINNLRPNTAGELNYCITRLCLDYLNDSAGRYSDFNEVIGALECAKLELYRRKVAAYEDKKIAENGDVY